MNCHELSTFYTYLSLAKWWISQLRWFMNYLLINYVNCTPGSCIPFGLLPTSSNRWWCENSFKVVLVLLFCSRTVFNSLQETYLCHQKLPVRERHLNLALLFRSVDFFGLVTYLLNFLTSSVHESFSELPWCTKIRSRLTLRFQRIPAALLQPQ